MNIVNHKQLRLLIFIVYLCFTILELTASDSDWDRKSKIKFPDGKVFAQFKVKHEKIKIEFGQKKSAVITGKLKDSGKRKYYLDDSKFIGSVKWKDSAFKIKDSKGELLWKVKVTYDKVKIRKTEIGESPYIIKKSDNQKLKIFRNEQLIGKVIYYQEKQKIKVEDATGKVIYKSKSNELSLMYGVLLFDEIPEVERLILIAELF